MSEERNNFIVGNLKIINRPKDSQILKFQNSFNFQSTEDFVNIQNTTDTLTTTIAQTSKKQNLNFNTNLSFESKLKNGFFKTNTFFNLQKLNNEFVINSDNPFLQNLFFEPTTKIDQVFNTDKITSGFGIEYGFKTGNWLVSFNSNTSYNNEKLTSSLFANSSESTFNNNLLLSRFFNQIRSSFVYQSDGVIQFSAAIDYNFTANKFNNSNENVLFFGGNVSIKTIFTSNEIAQVSYSFSNDLAPSENLILSPIISSYRTASKNQDVRFNSLFPKHNLTLNYFKFNPKKNFSLILSSVYSFKDLSINNNLQAQGRNVLYTYSTVDLDRQLQSLLYVSSKIPKLPAIFSTNISHNFSKNNFFEDFDQSSFENENFSIGLDVKSNFTKTPLDVNLGTNLSFDTFESEGNKNTLDTKIYRIGFEGNSFKYLSWNLDFEYSLFRSNNNKRKVFSVNPELRFKSKNKKMEYFISGNNIFNLKRLEILENNSTSNYFEQNITRSLPGYLLGGIRWKF